ncbi:GIY-YIG nuclease family protein [Streptomyces sp. UG1]|uniref:GIY-YIG nuclease family protein n=1 Tax=Streptomyces sp. UG1 TaxID=3417652 RepID=UPI003CF9BBAD
MTTDRRGAPAHPPTPAHAWRFALFIVSAAAVATTGWSLYAVARYYEAPKGIAGAAVAVFDGAAYACLYLASQASGAGRSAAGPRLAALVMAAVSVYLNITHADLIGGGIPAAVFFAMPTVALLAVAEMSWAGPRAAMRAELGEKPFRLPTLGGWAWTLAPRLAGSTVKARAVDHIEAARRVLSAADVAAIRALRDAHPDMPPAELAVLAAMYGVTVDAAQVALVLAQSPASITLERADAATCDGAEAAAEIRAARMERERLGRARRRLRQAWEQAIADLRRIEFSKVPDGRHGPVVYFLRNGDRVKIGTSTNLRHRIETLSLRRPDLILVVEGDRNIERAFHDRFAPQRVGFTEWFYLEGDLNGWLRTARRDLPPVPWPPPWPPYEESEPSEPDGQVTVERADDADSDATRAVAQTVVPPVAELAAAPFRWEDIDAVDGDGKTTAALASAELRQMVTATVTVTLSELRRRARKLNRESVRSTSRPVTIKTLQEELGLSRREATELRREIVGGERS